MARAAKIKHELPIFWDQAKRELGQADPRMKEIISRYQGEILKSRGSAFETLARSIVGQQISVKAAESVWQKVLLRVRIPTPEMFLTHSVSSLRKCGLSERKVIYLKDLAQHFKSGKIHSRDWARMTDEEIITELTDVKGIGRWTAEMFLIFHLLRPDVFPKADLGLQKGLSVAYSVKYPVSDKSLERFRKKFSPWGSVATWYLWRILDPIPVEY